MKKQFSLINLVLSTVFTCALLLHFYSQEGYFKNQSQKEYRNWLESIEEKTLSKKRLSELPFPISLSFRYSFGGQQRKLEVRTKQKNSLLTDAELLRVLQLLRDSNLVDNSVKAEKVRVNITIKNKQKRFFLKAMQEDFEQNLPLQYALQIVEEKLFQRSLEEKEDEKP